MADDMMGGNGYGNTPGAGGNPMMGEEQGEASVKCVKVYLKADGSYAVSSEEGKPIPPDAKPAADVVEALDMAEDMLAGDEEGPDDLEAMEQAMAGYNKRAPRKMKAGKGPFGGYDEE